MTIADQLQQWLAQGIELALHENGRDLRFRARPGAITDEIRAQVVARKADLVAHLTRTTRPISRGTETAGIALSAAQRRLWLQEQLHGAPNNLAGAIRLRGPLAVPALRAALAALFARHESFRTRITGDLAGEPTQEILPADGFTVANETMSGDDAAALARRVTELAREPFDLRGPLLRAHLIRLGEEDHVLFINLPHIAADGVSLQIFDRELADLYLGRPLPPLGLRYADYARWEQTQPEDPAAVAYWEKQLADVPLATLPADRLTAAELPFSAADCSLPLLNRAEAERLKQFGRERGATPFMSLLAAFGLYFSRVTGEEDFAIATAITNRPRPELQELVGFFLNLIALRLRPTGRATFGELLADVREAALGAYRHQELRFERIVERLQPERVRDRNPIARIAFAVGDTPWMPGHTVQLPGLAIAPVQIERGMLDFDLHCWISDDPAGLTGRLEYRTDLYTRETARRFLARFRVFLQQLVQGLERPIAALDAVTPEERASLLQTWCGAPASAADCPTVTEGFRAMAGRFPDRPAVEFGREALTYRELDRRSGLLAESFVAQGLQSREIVALLLPRSAALVVAMLAALKAGGAYLPIDPETPAERIAFLLTDSRARLLLVDGAPPTGRFAVPILPYPPAPAGQPRGPERPCDPAGLAYVIYTSGSTGQPKGVCVPHRAICRLVRRTNYLDLTPDDRIAQAANAAFDAATFEIWGALLNGATVVGIGRETTLSPADFARTLTERRITVLFVTTALFNLLVRESAAALTPLRYLLFGGERVDVESVRALLRAGGPRHLLHVYGPTENTTFSTYHPINDVPADAETIPIGRPITGTSAYILAADGALVPPGTPGELYLGGAGLADAYLDRPDLTAQAFVSHPFAAGARLYRTGDIVRHNTRGEIEFIGRRDSQIKLRGFRIELGEIESALCALPGVQGAVVIVEPGAASPRIVGYVVGQTTAEALRAGLEQSLPDYMVPGALLVLPEFPLNRNGKIERKRLPPAASLPGAGQVPPRDLVEQALAEIWQHVIAGGPVGVHDHFFDIGGHSLLATRVVSQVRALFGIDAALSAVFEFPTVARFAAWLRPQLAAGAPADAAPLVAMARGPDLPLSSAQQRLWFLDQLTPGTPAYNIPCALRLAGPLQTDALERAIAGLVTRHESLRTRFAAHGGHPVQVIAATAPGALPIVDLRAGSAAERERQLDELLVAEAVRPFDLATGPLLRTQLYRLDDEHWVLGFTLHHIIADGWSLAVLRRDLSALYNAAVQGNAAALPPLPVQYADFAVWQKAQLPRLGAQLDYWRRQLAGLETLRLPTDFPRPPVAGYRGAAHRFTIPGETVAPLRALSRAQDATLYMTLLTAFGLQLARYSRQHDFAVGSPIANRQQAALENLIGFFVNTLVMRCRFDAADSFRTALRRMRTSLLEAYVHQDLPFERLVEELDPVRDPGFNPLIQVIFALQNAPDSGAQFAQVNLEPLEYRVATTRFDLELHLWEAGGRLDSILVYNTALFTPETMARFARCYATLLRSVAAGPEQPVGRLRLTAPPDEAAALVAAAAVPYPRDRSLVDVFREQASRRPDHPALATETGTMSYAELDARSDHLARRLAAAGVGGESPVVLQLERSPEVVVSLLAVLKAGGCYVPLETDHPASRTQQIVAEIAPRLVLDRATYDRLMDEPDSATQALPASGPEDLAYIIYTSGSTGQPKGSRIPQRAVMRLVKNTNFHPFGPDEVFLLASSLAFDASTLELWGPLLNGATLAILPPGRGAFADIGAAVRRHGVTTLWLTAGLFHLFVDEHLHDLRGVRHLLAGGDVLSPRHVEKALRALPGLTLINGYGPTENTTFTCCHVMRGETVPGATVPLGLPVANTWVVIVDETLAPVPDGVPGELLAGGDGLARDYCHRPALTAEKFIPNPFPAIPGPRLYRTGDLVRRRPDGTIEFLGRIDRQLKIRGYRIEPGEIEHLLRSHPGVQDAVVRAHGDADKKLAAYVVPAAPRPEAGKEKLEAEQVRDWATLFDESLYRSLEPAGDATFNIAGWKSSFTGAPIPAAEMRAWLDDFVATVRRARPRRVLEIGCGTGLVLFRVAPDCEHYTGCDFSGAALDYVRSHLPPASRVDLLRREAADFSGFAPGQFDTVILNSVVQYFPDAAYLRTTIAGALAVVGDGGTVILGDLRSLPLLRAFHSAVEWRRAPADATVLNWRIRVERALLAENELAVAPAFFAALGLPRIARVSFRLQRPAHDNELSQFRYTAILHVGPPCPAPAVDWRETADPAAVERIAREERPACFGLRAVPNARVQRAAALAAWSESAQSPDLSLAAAGRQIDPAGPAGDDPVRWWDLGEKLGYCVEVGWAATGEPGSCAVVFTRPDNSASFLGVPWTSATADVPLTSHPLRGKLARALGPQLRAWCQERLPDYMVPASFTVLPGFPLTANGKINDRALPAPEPAGTPASATSHEDAQNELEQSILAVWCDVLGVTTASVKANFFDLGGHSLLMVQACSRLKERLRRDVPVMLMFQHPTIRSLAAALSAAPAVPAIRAGALERAQRQRASFANPAPRKRP